ncbi:hypothetical protein [Arenibacter sp. ARW7G5Y1]|uniref:hypothetical protein n=1 Tax=Arenibacter sp. ARW7G5Y1 TaxID=2135619 RepID=UPI0011B3FFE7|nr:hypothetical protein [Arenibacter sp. ARW7G5Y1]
MSPKAVLKDSTRVKTELKNEVQDFYSKVRSNLKKKYLGEVEGEIYRRRDSLNDLTLEIIQSRIKQLNKYVSDKPLNASNVSHYIDFSLSEIAEIHDILSRDNTFAWPNCTEDSQLEIVDLGYDNPNGELLQQSSILYVTGGQVELKLQTEKCLKIKSVTLISTYFQGNKKELSNNTGFYDEIEQQWIVDPFRYEDSYTTINEEQHEISAKIILPNYKDGRSFDVEIEISNNTSSFKKIYEFTISCVKDVVLQNSPFAKPILSLSELYLKNKIITGIYGMFGDDGRMTTASGKTVYNPDYKNIYFNIDNGIIQFRLKAKVDLPTCDPVILINMDMKLLPLPVGFEIETDTSVDFDAPLWCDIISLSLADNIMGLFESKIKKAMKEEVEDIISKSIEDNNFFIASIFIDEISSYNHELNFLFINAFNQLKIDVPYNTKRLNDAFKWGVAFSPNQNIGLIPGGRTEIEYTHDSETQFVIGPFGIFNWNNDVPIPNPWILTNSNIYVYHKQRDYARKALQGVRRMTPDLILQNTGIGRTIMNSNYEGIIHTLPKILKTPDSDLQSRIVFGNNDHLYINVAEQGNGNWELSIILIPFDINL